MVARIEARASGASERFDMKDYVRNTRGRMFESDFFELLSKVHPSTPFILFVPIVAAVLGFGLFTGKTTLACAATFFPLGVVTWQLLEYFIHKRLFHWRGIGPISRRFHDIAHGFHHKYPDDAERLVMPLAVSVPLAVFFGIAALLVHRPSLALPWWCGLVAGYLFYDFMHWSTHFRRPLTKWGAKMRAHHMAHHFADPDSNFGISHRYVDRALGTLQKRGSRGERAEGEVR
jgi:sterol desaturase/sphingolipid hydroxylase (fatty acid hydroxylase superfamily)